MYYQPFASYQKLHRLTLYNKATTCLYIGVLSTLRDDTICDIVTTWMLTPNMITDEKAVEITLYKQI
jgi:hypothetical protein